MAHEPDESGETAEPDQSQGDSETAAQERPSGSAQSADPESIDDDPLAHDASGGEPAVETTYERTSTGHRVIRRTVRKRTTVEDLEETIEEDFDIPAYEGPVADHPAPVG